MSTWKNDVLKRLLTLRLLVAFLGEKDQFTWWATRFLGSTGNRFLAFTFPRSVFAAGVTAASEAARAFHDHRIGKGRVYHLFRFPQMIEQRLHALLLSADSDELRSLVGSKDAALRALAEFSKNGTPVTDGPVCLGDSKLLSSGAAIPKLAALYLGAFKTAKQTLPYFTAVHS